MNPRTVCFCQPICVMISSRVAPFGLCRSAITFAVLLPSRTPVVFGSAAFLGAFGVFFCRVALVPESGGTGATSGTCAPASATGSAGAGSLFAGGWGWKIYACVNTSVPQSIDLGQGLIWPLSRDQPCLYPFTDGWGRYVSSFAEENGDSGN
jgi:hypothetical protein